MKNTKSKESDIEKSDVDECGCGYLVPNNIPKKDIFKFIKSGYLIRNPKCKLLHHCCG